MVTGRFDLERFSGDLFGLLSLPRPERLGRAVDKRLAEFVAGRSMARLAQEALGHMPQPVRIDDCGAPIWPAGLAGSISHSHGNCACLMLPEGLGHPGVDAEAIVSDAAFVSIEKLVLSGRDKAKLRASALPHEVAATLCFSAKETLYKALYPTVQRFFGFAAAELAEPPEHDRIRLRLTETLSADLTEGLEFDLTCQIATTSVLTWMRHPASSI